MKKYIELDTTPYWQEAVREEVKFLRQERNKHSAESMTKMAVFLVLSFLAYLSYSRGYLDNVDVLGTFYWIGDQVAVLANNLSNLIKNISA